MNELEHKLDCVRTTLCILNTIEDYAEEALLMHNTNVREYNYLVLLTNWVRGETL